MRNDLSDYEWTTIKPMLPNKPRGVRRVNDRRVLNGIFWVLRSGAPWRDLPENYGPRTTCYNRFVRWRRALRAFRAEKPRSFVDWVWRHLPRDVCFEIPQTLLARAVKEIEQERRCGA